MYKEKGAEERNKVRKGDMREWYERVGEKWNHKEMC